MGLKTRCHWEWIQPPFLTTSFCALHPHVCHANLNVRSWNSIWVCRITWVYHKYPQIIYDGFPRSPILRLKPKLYIYIPSDDIPHPIPSHYITMMVEFEKPPCSPSLPTSSADRCPGPKEEEQQELFGDAGRDGYLQQRIHRQVWLWCGFDVWEKKHQTVKSWYPSKH